MQSPDDKNHLQKLAHKWKQGEISVEELAEFNAWYDGKSEAPLELPKNYAAGLLALRDRLHSQLMENIAQPRRVKSSNLTMYRRIAAAASIIIALSAGIWFYITSQPHVEKDLSDRTHFVNDIAPGKNIATLTLASGKTITLNDTKTGVIINASNLTYNDGSVVRGIDPGLHPDNKHVSQTITTPRGGTYQVTLTDGTKVWLNSASSLTYTTGINKNGERKVKLEGEGYFEVAKDSKHPFVVESNHQRVQVLGTHFNINSYGDEDVVKTTLLEGSVRVSLLKNVSRNDGREQPIVLKPNQQSLLTGNTIKVTEANTEETLAWKNGYFVFESESIKPIMRKIARWYDVEVSYSGDQPTDKFWGTVSRFSNVSQVLEKLELTNKVHFEIEGRRIIVTR